MKSRKKECLICGEGREGLVRDVMYDRERGIRIPLCLNHGLFWKRNILSSGENLILEKKLVESGYVEKTSDVRPGSMITTLNYLARR